MRPTTLVFFAGAERGVVVLFKISQPPPLPPIPSTTAAVIREKEREREGPLLMTAMDGGRAATEAAGFCLPVEMKQPPTRVLFRFPKQK